MLSWKWEIRRDKRLTKDEGDVFIKYWAIEGADVSYLF